MEPNHLSKFTCSSEPNRQYKIFWLFIHPRRKFTWGQVELTLSGGLAVQATRQVRLIMLEDSTNISGPPTRRVTGSEGHLRVFFLAVTSDP